MTIEARIAAMEVELRELQRQVNPTPQLTPFGKFARENGADISKFSPELIYRQ